LTACACIICTVTFYLSAVFSTLRARALTHNDLALMSSVPASSC